MTQWIKHDGGPMPVHNDTVVKLKLTEGFLESKAGMVCWFGNKGEEYAIIRAHPDCPSLKNTAVDMARAGIAPSVEVSAYVLNVTERYNSFVRDHFSVVVGGKSFACLSKSDAQWLADRLNGKA